MKASVMRKGGAKIRKEGREVSPVSGMKAQAGGETHQQRRRPARRAAEGPGLGAKGRDGVSESA